MYQPNAYVAAAMPLRLKDLLPEMSEGVSGIVISKRDVRSYQSPRGDGSAQFVYSLTIRDSQQDSITINVWGSEEYVKRSFDGFAIPDPVEVRKFQVRMKGDSEGKFNPPTTSQFSLHVSERGHGIVQRMEGAIPHYLAGLERTPVCKPNDFYTLADASEFVADLAEQTIHLLACVKKVGPVEKLTSKNGKPLFKTELILFDETTNSMYLTIWDRSNCEWAQSWSGPNTVLFASDVRVAHNQYRGKVTATSTCRSVFICNPDTNEAHRLFQFAQDYEDQMEGIADDLDVDQPVSRTVAELIQFGESSDETRRRSLSLTQAAITQLDIDCSSKKLLSFRCSSCGLKVISDNIVACPNARCPTNAAGADLQVERSYDFRMSLSDHTGTLEQCRVTERAAEKMLGMKLDDFVLLDGERLTAIKWQWLLERCRLVLRSSLSRFGACYFRVESCERASPEELMRIGFPQ